MSRFRSKQIKLSDLIHTPIQTGFQIRGRGYFDSKASYTFSPAQQESPLGQPDFEVTYNSSNPQRDSSLKGQSCSKASYGLSLAQQNLFLKGQSKDGISYNLSNPQKDFSLKGQSNSKFSNPQKDSSLEGQSNSKVSNPQQDSFSQQEQSKAFYSLIQVKDTRQSLFSQIKSKKFDTIFVPAKKRKFMEKYLLQKQDLLYLSKLRPGAFRYKGSIETILPMSHFYILRPKPEIVDSDYLCWALNQAFMKVYVQRCLKGSALPFISKEALMDFKVPLPSRDIQKRIVTLLDMRIREKEIQTSIEQKKNIFINTILNKLL